MITNEPCMYIFVLDRGFVVVGEAVVSTDYAFTWHVKSGCTVRRWGTTNGLAQLKDGPTNETITDGVCERYIPFRSEIERLVVSEKGAKAWKKRLSS